ncbi:MAG: TonB-dependent receptor, partial [Acidobacteriota bacterium]|nr:TonB-dependent receptor [Acidobacteriota bacterium]
TVVNVLMKSGTNKFHGSGWWYGRRTALNANDFFSNRNGIARAQSTRDQYGFALTGPVIKGKTFFLFDLERLRQNDKRLISGRVPTDLERTGDFSQTLTQDDNGNLVPIRIYDPFSVTGPNQIRREFPNAIIPAFGTPGSPITAIGQALVNAYPNATGPIDPATGLNFNKGAVDTSTSTQFDIKIDHQLNDRTRLMGRYSQSNSSFSNPDFFYGDLTGVQKTRNIVLEHTWTIRPNVLLTNRFGVDRYHQVGASKRVDPTQFGLPGLLTQANGITRLPLINVDNYITLNNQCCSDTVNGHTQYVFSSAVNWVKGKHVLKLGGEQRLFFNNFFQPDYATGLFNFTKLITASNPAGGNPSEEGTGLASMLLGFPGDGQLNIKSAIQNKSKETAFYVQDDWKVTPRLTLNVGLRYEWSTPYTERSNRIQFSDFAGNSGVTVDLTAPKTDSGGNPLVDDNGNPVNLSGLGLGPTALKGITHFVTSGRRHVPIDRNNFGPRLGFAFQLASNTVLRGGAGIFYGLSSATNFQYAGTAFRRDAPIHFSNDGGITQYATLTNLFPNLPPGQVPTPQGKKYGPLANWGYVNQNDLGSTTARNGEIYQWNLGLQHLFPFGVVISADYSANRSTHLPWGGATRNRNVISTAARLACDTTCQNTPVANPFLPLFNGSNAIFNEPDSRYSQDAIPFLNLLRPYPQFDNNFEGLPLLTASSWYNGFLARFQKRPSHGLSFEGNYTWSKATDNSSYGANSFIFFGGSGLGYPQDLNNLAVEHSVGANDTRHRFVLAAIYDVPIGRGRSVGNTMNRFLDGVIGGWSLNSLLTLQSGQPVPFGMSSPRLTDGFQRPNIICNPATGLSLHDVAMSQDPNASYFKAACLTDPGDQIAGNAPRFSDNVRGPGIRNIDLGIFKDFPIRERVKAQVRAEFLNFTNTPRFATPSSFQGDSFFGKVTALANVPRRIQMGVRLEF